MQPANPQHRVLDVLFPALACALLLGWARAWWPYTVDDAFITLRYAHGLASGLGPVFTAGERVEGFSSPAHVLLTATLERAGLDPLLAIKWTGVVASVLLLLLLHAALRRSGASAALSGCVVVGLAALPSLAIYSTAGLETTMFALLVACGTFLPMFLAQQTTLRAVLLALVLLEIALGRPEGSLIAFGLAVVAWRGGAPLAERRAIVAAGALFAVLLLARQSYFGSLLPNTFLAKPAPVFHLLLHPTQTSSLRDAVLPLLVNFGAALDRIGGAGVLGAALLPFAAGARDRITLSAGAAAAAGIAFALYAPGDWMPEHRFMLPVIAPILFLAVAGMRDVGARLDARIRRFATPSLFALTALVIAIDIGQTARLLQRYRGGEVNEALHAERFRGIGRWLRAHARPSESVLTYEIGAVGYESGLRVVDHEGLVDPTVARLVRAAGGYARVRDGDDPMLMNAIARYCLRRRPDWFLVRCANVAEFTPGRALVPEAAREKLQQALVRGIGERMRIRAVFRLSDPADLYVLLGPPPAAGAPS